MVSPASAPHRSSSPTACSDPERLLLISVTYNCSSTPATQSTLSQPRKPNRLTANPTSRLTCSSRWVQTGGSTPGPTLTYSKLCPPLTLSEQGTIRCAPWSSTSTSAAGQPTPDGCSTNFCTISG